MAWPLTASSGYVECGIGVPGQAKWWWWGCSEPGHFAFGGLVTETVETRALLRERLHCSLC